MKEILIYDVIGAYGSDAKTIITQLDEAKGKEVLIRINSVGGDVFEGMAIYNALIKHEGKVNVEIEGLAASMASIIMLAGDSVSASENSLIMLHNPSAGMQGESKDLKKRADLLDKMKTQMVSIYSGKTEMSEKDVIGMMDEETWFTSNEALAVGLIDNVTDAIKIAATFELGIISNKVPEWVKESYNNKLIEEKEMDKVIAMLSELKDSIKGFVDNSSNGITEIKILDDENISAQIVEFSKKISELESISDELIEVKGHFSTMEDTIATLTSEKESLETEINKNNATPSEVENTQDPVIIPATKGDDTWSDTVADILTDDAFNFIK